MSKSGLSIIQGAKEALEFIKGKNNDYVAHVLDEIDVAAIRSKLNMSQTQFSSLLGLSSRILKDWEQGRSAPSGASKVLLQVLSKEPEAVIRALQE